MKGFIEVTLLNDRKRLVNINICKISSVGIEQLLGTINFYTTIHFVDACKGEEDIIVVKEPYEEVKELIHNGLSPFKAEVRDNKIYGRGTSDDKGGAIASLTALKIIKEMNKRDKI